jgi:GAF domain-containing protein
MMADSLFVKDRELADMVAREVRSLLEGSGVRDDILLSVCRLLSASVPYYHWVGFYLVDPESRDELILGPYIGEPTEHTRIPFGKGICGQAASSKQLFLVPDVTKEGNYLSCSPKVRSEIVVPVLSGDRVLGELDIDSHLPDPFDDWDMTLLTRVCDIVAEVL